MRSEHRHRLTLLSALALLGALAPPALAQTAIAEPPATTAPATATASADLDARIALLCERLETARQEMHIPGMAIAVVKDDEVILARGFGVADVETQRPVDADTLFAIGSSTKGFTTAVIAMLVEDGVMAWDEPVTTYLHEFTLDVDTGGEAITVRDLCCHRTGFTRMGLLWAGGTVPREEVLELAKGAKPWGDFREGFLYNNVMFLAAGMAAGAAADSDWDALMATRIFQPLGMGNSGTHISAVADDLRLAKGYQWNEEKETFKHQPMRDLDVIGPAGSINSNVTDMAGWVRFQLGRGEFEGRRMVAAEGLEATWAPQIQIAPGIEYGLGWMLRDWNGMTVVEHGGNIDGFGAEVALLPEANLGFVLLTNVTATPLQSTSVSMVFDTLLGEVDEDGARLAQSELEPYVGTYIANIGATFTDAEFTVLVKNGNLAVDVPGQMVYELKPPDEQGLWVFAMTDQIAVSFNNEDGDEQAYSMIMYQAGMEFEMPRKGHEYEPEVPLAELQRYLGAYHDSDLDADVTVLIRNNRLAIDVPGQMVFELHPPDEEGHWAFRARPADLQLRFDEAEDGSIASITAYQRGEESLLPRVEGADAGTLPTVDELLALVRRGYGVEGRGSIGTCRATGTVDFVHQGPTGRITVLNDGSDRYRLDFDLGTLGFMTVAMNGTAGWSDSSFHPFTELEGMELQHRRLDHPFRALGDWRAQFERIAILRAEKIGEEVVYVVRLENEKTPVRTVYVSADRGVIIRERSAEIAMQGAMTVPITIEYDDFREVGGLTLPFRMSSENEHSGRTVVQMEQMELDVPLPEDAFAAPDAAAVTP